MARHAHRGRLEWIGLRPARRADIVMPDAVVIGPDGPDGDHANGGKKAVTLIQAEHLSVIAQLSGQSDVLPEHLRRNLMVSGINFYALRKTQLQIGDAVLQVEGPCPPCSRMEEILGHGGYNAMRGHGGWYASVVRPGRVALGVEVMPL